MGFYILKRLFFIIPFTVFVVFFTLVLNQHFSISSVNWEYQSKLNEINSIQEIEKIDCERRNFLHQNLPLFYFTIQSSVIPQDILKICSENERHFLRMLCISSGNQKEAQNLFQSIRNLNLPNENIDIRRIFNVLSVSELHGLLEDESFVNALEIPLKSYLASKNNVSPFIPKIYFNGIDNQFHFWLKSATNFDFGNSVVNSLPVVDVVNNALRRTLVFTVPAVLLLFMVSIVLGLYIVFSGKKTSSIMLNSLLFLDAIPLFWLSILLIVIAGSFFSITETIIGIESSNYLDQYLLPILALVISSIPYLSKQVQSSVEQVIKEPYIQTALSKGISRHNLILRHVFPNALIPLTVLFFNYLAFAFGGAFVVEIIFSIAGIGKLMAESILSNDFQVASLILLYLVVIKMVLMIMSDLVQYYLHPSYQIK